MLSLESGDVLQREQQPITHVFFLTSGMATLLVVMPDRKLAEVGYVNAGGIVGASYSLSRRVSSTRATMVSGGTALRVPLEKYEIALSSSTAFRDAVWEVTQLTLQRAHQIAACNLLHRLEARICRWLLQVNENVESKAVTVTQEDLARMLGVNRARLNEALKTLQDAGAIAPSARGTIEIAQPDLLAKSACDCHELLHCSDSA